MQLSPVKGSIQLSDAFSKMIRDPAVVKWVSTESDAKKPALDFVQSMFHADGPIKSLVNAVQNLDAFSLVSATQQHVNDPTFSVPQALGTILTDLRRHITLDTRAHFEDALKYNQHWKTYLHWEALKTDLLNPESEMHAWVLKKRQGNDAKASDIAYVTDLIVQLHYGCLPSAEKYESRKRKFENLKVVGAAVEGLIQGFGNQAVQLLIPGKSIAQ